MKDQYGRKIDYMRVSVTDRCNLRCVYCMPAEGIQTIPHEQILTFDEIARICRIGTRLGISKIRLTGGEPLVRRNLVGLVGMLHRILGIEKVSLTTNGILLSNNINELVSNGLDGVNISLDTMNPVRYGRVTRGGELNKALEGLEAALTFPSLNVKINCVPLDDGGAEDWVRLASLARERKVEVRFIEMMPVGLGKNFRGRSREEVLRVLESSFGTPEEYTGRLGNGPAAYVHFQGFCGRIGFISAVSHRFCDSCNRVRLTSTGILKPCLQYGGGTDLRELLRGGASDEEVEEKMRETIFLKPSGHHFAEKGEMSEKERSCLEKKEMWSIGG